MAWLGVDRWTAVAVGFAIELLAAVLLGFADWRRTDRGEQAIAARVLSVAVALGVAAPNFYGHDTSVGQRMLFTGASLAGYAVWTLHSNARRRDALRAAGRLAAQPSVFGLAAWLRSPKMVWRVRRAVGGGPAARREMVRGGCHPVSHSLSSSAHARDRAGLHLRGIGCSGVERLSV
jgi:hypothetical protein